MEVEEYAEPLVTGLKPTVYGHILELIADARQRNREIRHINLDLREWNQLRSEIGGLFQPSPWDDLRIDGVMVRLQR